MSEYTIEIVWRNVILMSILHLGAIYGIISAITDCKYKTIVFAYILWFLSCIGIMVGSHRLWTHRAFKAKLSLQIILAILQTMAFQNDIIEWTRDHRVHHKYSETDADPHNANRGFFFSHVGWLLCRKHPDVKEMGKSVDISDVAQNPVARFQRRFYYPLLFTFWAAVPILIPCLFWEEKLTNSIFICLNLRYALVLNTTWLVNSAAHMWGTKPYDKLINPVECIIRDLIGGEGFHNYHHTYPWDYSASEYGPSDVFNLATFVIDIFAKIGWAYDLKKVPRLTIEKKKAEFGDKSLTKQSKLKELTLGVLTYLSHFLILILLKVLYNQYES